jgi:uncharacterized DUF497 family protein
LKHFRILWDDDENPDGNVQHIADHGLTIEDVEHVLEHPAAESTSQSTGRPCVFGYTPAGDYIIVIYEAIAEDTIYPITAYEVPEPSEDGST